LQETKRQREKETKKREKERKREREREREREKEREREIFKKEINLKKPVEQELEAPSLPTNKF